MAVTVALSLSFSLPVTFCSAALGSFKFSRETIPNRRQLFNRRSDGVLEFKFLSFGRFETAARIYMAIAPRCVSSGNFPGEERSDGVRRTA